MLDKKELLAEDFIRGLAATLPMDRVAGIIASAKKGMDIRFKNRIDASWKPTELKNLRDRLLFGRWNWVSGRMFRQSWDGTVTQDVTFFYPDSQIRLEGMPKSQLTYRMLEKVAGEAVANCDGDTEVKVSLNEEQLRTLCGLDEGGVK